MKYQQPYGVSDANASYVDGNPALGIEGSAVPAKALEHGQRELVHLITKAGLTPKEEDLEQVYKAIQIIIRGMMPEEKPIYKIGEWKTWFEISPPTGWAVRNGGLLLNASERYPDLWAWLQEPVNLWKVKTESEWQALSNTTPWNGIGGVVYFAMNTTENTVRLPDTRGMYAEDAGFDGLEVGNVHEDAIREIAGSVTGFKGISGGGNATGAFTRGSTGGSNETNGSGTGSITFSAARVVPIANKNQPRAFGILPCIYIGGA